MTPEALKDAISAGAARLKGAALKHLNAPLPGERRMLAEQEAAAILGYRQGRGRRGRGDDDEQILGLDRRPRPSTMRQRIIIGLRRSAPFSSLQRRIIFFNLIGLAVLVFGVLWLNQFRSGLIEQRFQSLSVEGEIIAVTIAEAAGDYREGEIVPATERPELDSERASQILGSLTRPARVRARLYDTDLRLVADTRSTAAGASTIVATPLAAPGTTRPPGPISRLERFYDELIFPTDTGAVYAEIAEAGISLAPEVRQAALGNLVNAVRVNSEQNLIVSVAMPVRRFKSVLGVLVLSTEGDDINEIVRRERVGILQIFVAASIVSIGLSVLLAFTIASPIRRLVQAVDPMGTSAARPINPDRIEIPDMTGRVDEIGDLSAALRRMTSALYRRIEAIESFAADVAHEIKNPLTSMRSAIETFHYAKTPEQRQRLLDVIMSDVKRLDRLVTDISNASRLDAELVRERMDDFDLGTLLESLAGVTRNQGEAVRVRVTVDLPKDGLIASGLEGRLAQVFANLLDNALSFSPEGTAIAVQAREEDEIITVTVTDQGPGIPPDNLESIFERFYSERPEQSFGNHSGLGLAICRQIVEAHDGEIWAENVFVPGAGPDASPIGARFIVELPT
ncbi:MAG: stimulus-sensing domain-containing protein [Pseudomonadota bacterium]